MVYFGFQDPASFEKNFRKESKRVNAGITIKRVYRARSSHYSTGQITVETIDFLLSVVISVNRPV